MSLLIPYVNSIQNVGSYAIMRDPTNPSVFHLVSRERGTIAMVDMLNQQSINSFKSVLETIDMPLQNSTLVARIGDTSKSTPEVFKKVKRFFGQHADAQSLVITPDIKFDRSDIQDRGLTGFAWYIKTGRLVTNYKNVIAPIVSIGDVNYFTPGQTTQATQVNTAEQNGVDDGIIDLTGLFKRRTEKDSNKPRLTPEQIKKNLRPILGDEVDDPTVIKIITDIAQDPRFTDASVVGLAHTYGIRLYGDAFTGVDYHEAFHRIFELFVNPQVRDKIYDNVAKRIGVDLSKSSKENDYTPHRLVAEYCADKYMDYKLGEFDTGIKLLDRVLNYIRDIVNILAHWSDRQLYKVFMEVNSGKYRSERRKNVGDVERFKTMFKELNYEIHSEEFKHILNDPMYEDVKNTAYYCITLGQKIDLSGATIQDVKINRDAFMRGAESLKEHGFDIFGNEVEPEDKTVGQLAMSEAYVNFEAISDDIAAMMSVVATDYKKIRRQEAEEDRDGDEESIGSSYDENFFKWDYEFDRFDKTSSRVKYFFANIPDMRYDEFGNPVIQVNDLGMPQLIPMKYVFNEVLTQLWDVDTIDEVLERLSRLSTADPMWKIIYDNL